MFYYLIIIFLKVITDIEMGIFGGLVKFWKEFIFVDL